MVKHQWRVRRRHRPSRTFHRQSRKTTQIPRHGPPSPRDRHRGWEVVRVKRRFNTLRSSTELDLKSYWVQMLQRHYQLSTRQSSWLSYRREPSQLRPYRTSVDSRTVQLKRRSFSTNRLCRGNRHVRLKESTTGWWRSPKGLLGKRQCTPYLVDGNPYRIRSCSCGSPTEQTYSWINSWIKMVSNTVTLSKSW